MDFAAVVLRIVFRGSDWVKGLQYEVYSNLYWEVSIGFRQTTNYQCSMYAVIGWKAKEYYCRIFQNRCSKGNHQYVSQKEATHHHWRILLQDIQFPLQTLAFFLALHFMFQMPCCEDVNGFHIPRRRASGTCGLGRVNTLFAF